MCPATNWALHESTAPIYGAPRADERVLCLAPLNPVRQDQFYVGAPLYVV